MPRVEISASIAARVRGACAHLPEAYEEHPRGGYRWRVRGRTFADMGTQRLADDSGVPVTYVTFHARDELTALLAVGHPFYPAGEVDWWRWFSPMTTPRTGTTSVSC